MDVYPCFFIFKNFKTLTGQHEPFLGVLVRIRHCSDSNHSMKVYQFFGQSVGYIDFDSDDSPLVPVRVSYLRSVTVDAPVFAPSIRVKSVVYARESGRRQCTSAFYSFINAVPFFIGCEIEKISNSPQSSFGCTNLSEFPTFEPRCFWESP